MKWLIRRVVTRERMLRRRAVLDYDAGDVLEQRPVLAYPLSLGERCGIPSHLWTSGLQASDKLLPVILLADASKG